MLKFLSRDQQTLSIIYDTFSFLNKPIKISCPFTAPQVQPELLYHRKI